MVQGLKKLDFSTSWKISLHVWEGGRIKSDICLQEGEGGGVHKNLTFADGEGEGPKWPKKCWRHKWMAPKSWHSTSLDFVTNLLLIRNTFPNLKLVLNIYEMNSQIYFHPTSRFQFSYQKWSWFNQFSVEQLRLWALLWNSSLAAPGHLLRGEGSYRKHFKCLCKRSEFLPIWKCLRNITFHLSQHVCMYVLELLDI